MEAAQLKDKQGATKVQVGLLDKVDGVSWFVKFNYPHVTKRPTPFPLFAALPYLSTMAQDQHSAVLVILQHQSRASISNQLCTARQSKPSQIYN